MADWLAPVIGNITAVDVATTLDFHGFDYEKADASLKLYAIALVLGDWYDNLDKMQLALKELFPKNADARDYIVNVVVGEVAE